MEKIISFYGNKSKNGLEGTWTADLGADGIVTRAFDGNGKCTMNTEYMSQSGRYTAEDDQLKIKMENWSDFQIFTFTVGENTLVMNENTGYGISGTFYRQ